MLKQTSAPPSAILSTRRITSFDPQVALAFGAVIRSARVKQQVAQDQFALIAGIDRSYYGKLERGERQPSLALMLRIADALGVRGRDLMEQTELALLRKPK